MQALFGVKEVIATIPKQVGTISKADTTMRKLDGLSMQTGTQQQAQES